MINIINRYAREGTPFVFPVLDEGDSTADQFRACQSALRSHNRRLKRIAAMAGIRKNLSSYVARHSWASIAYAKGAELHVISRAMGHAEERTTLIYIEEIGADRVFLANRKILADIMAERNSGSESGDDR